MAQSLSKSALQGLTSWHSSWAGLRVLVVGLGHTGFAVVDTLRELGCEVTAMAAEAASDLVKLAEVVGARVLVDPEGAARAQDAVSVPWDLAVVSRSWIEGPGYRQPGDNGGRDMVRSRARLAAERQIRRTSRLDYGAAGRGDRYCRGPSTAHFPGCERSDSGCRVWRTPVLDALREPRSYDVLIVQVSRESLVWRQRYPQSLMTPALTVSLQAEGEDASGVFFDGTTRACVYRKGVGPTEAQVQDADVVEGARAIGIGLTPRE